MHSQPHPLRRHQTHGTHEQLSLILPALLKQLLFLHTFFLKHTQLFIIDLIENLTLCDLCVDGIDSTDVFFNEPFNPVYLLVNIALYGIDAWTCILLVL
jgi:hypothetical protein